MLPILSLVMVVAVKVFKKTTPNGKVKFLLFVSCGLFVNRNVFRSGHFLFGKA